MWLKLAMAALLKLPEAIEEWAVQTFKSGRMSATEYAAAMVAVIRKFDGRQMIWNHHQISHKWQHCGVIGPVALLQALGMLTEDTDTAPDVFHSYEGEEGTGKKVYGLLAHHRDIWNRLVELADSTQTIAAPQAEEEIEGFIVNMGVFVSGLQSSFGMGSMGHQSMPDQMKTYTHRHVLQKLVLVAMHWDEVHSCSTRTRKPRGHATHYAQAPAASHTWLPWRRWRLTGTIWENITMKSMSSICPDTEHLCGGVDFSGTAAEVESSFAVHAMMWTSWVCHLHGVPEKNRSTLDEAPTSGLIRLWHELRYKGTGGVEPSLSTLVDQLAIAQADGGKVKRKAPED
jgi:hypothetical protein